MYYRKLKPILDHEHLYEDLSAADKKRCQSSPFTVEEILGEKWLREKLRKSLSVLSEPERVAIKLPYKDELTPSRRPGSWVSPVLQFGLIRRMLSIS